MTADHLYIGLGLVFVLPLLLALLVGMMQR